MGRFDGGMPDGIQDAPTPGPADAAGAADAGGAAPPEPYARRWWALTALSMSLIIIVVAVSSMNVTLPSLVRELDASSTELQWIVDAYAMVFGGLLLFFGALGDRYGRKGALQIGLVIFGLASLVATTTDSPAQLIGIRATMGVGAALIMPATLSIIIAIFPSDERPRAIAVWVGFVGAGTSIGPVVGGYLLEHFWWGSVFFLNVPLVAIGLVGSALLVPRSRDDEHRGLDPVGGVLSIACLGGLLFGIIEGPELGWTDPRVITGFAVGLVVGLAFVVWERRHPQPMLVLDWFREPRFTVSALVITLIFFALFGFLFSMTQYLQFARDWSPLTAGAAMLPMAFTLAIASPRGARVAARHGPRTTIIVGVLLAMVALAALSRLTLSTPYLAIAACLVLLGAGMGLASPSATTGITTSLPLGKAGVGSAINDTTREVGGALGIAVLGSMLQTSYRASLDPHLAGLPAEAASTAQEGIGSALQVAARLPASAGAGLADAARDAFVHGMNFTLTGAAIVFGITALLVRRFHPAITPSAEGAGAHAPAPSPAAASSSAVAAPSAGAPVLRPRR